MGTFREDGGRTSLMLTEGWGRWGCDIDVWGYGGEEDDDDVDNM